ncbi:hypothetical protein CPB84DRAFT_1845241 [Gymnopilus junonius]|uniref:Uncharacterized protein n=1 Tax=Gymnopilus junonius TaxID=109634 RepID=A0A9P5TPD8_GYMJU|nr:hypothetical protein CPB84DRAFT_1845241 [Gymnopilus junonius]
MDLTNINQKTDAWKEEVLRRSGHSLLWIGGSEFFTANSDSSLFFDALLALHWERIEYLHAKRSYPSHNKVWYNLHCPTPNLRSCSVQWDAYLDESSLFPESSPPLFANLVPLLLHFSISCVKLDLKASWLADLRHFDFWFQLTTIEILRALQSMVHLESLGISWEGKKHPRLDSPSHLQIAILPNLIKLRLNHRSLTICNALLAHIRPAEGCVLSFDTTLDPGPSLQQELEQLSFALCSSFRSYLPVKPRSISQINLTMLANFFTFQCGPPDEWRPWGTKHAPPEFRLCFQASSHPTWSVLPLMSTFDLSAIQKLRLDVNTRLNVFPYRKYSDFLTFFPSSPPSLILNFERACSLQYMIYLSTLVTSTFFLSRTQFS